ncbi:hypothetical protein LLH23_08170 [bacterium]|nr:hypothetical protein [bacterium]
MSIADRLRNNLSLKLVSLIVALVIWGTVHNQADPLVARQQAVTVETADVPEGLAVADIDPTQITATLYGRRSALERLAYSNACLVADLKGAEIGTAVVPVEPRGFPPGIEIRHLSNRMVRVALDAVVTRARPVIVQVRGEPAQGFMVANTQVRPDEATVSGPSTEVRKVARVVAPVDISGHNDAAPVTVPLMAIDVGGLPLTGVTIEPPQAAVTVQLRQVNSRTVPVAPVIGKLPAGYEMASVAARPVVVTITGDAQKIAAVEALQTAPLDLTDEPGKTQYVVPLQLPAGVTVLGASSVRVTVALRKKGEANTRPAAGTTAPTPAAETTPEAPEGPAQTQPETPRPTPPAEGPPPAGAKPHPTAPVQP